MVKNPPKKKSKVKKKKDEIMNEQENIKRQSTRIWAGKFLQEFRASNNDSHVFDTSLTNIERGVIHNMCRGLGIESKSRGSGANRCLEINKRTCSSKTVEKEEQSREVKLQCVSLPPEAEPVLRDLFTRYPPCDGDTTGTSMVIYTGKSQRRWKDDYFCRPQMSEKHIKKKTEAHSSRMAKEKSFREISEARTKLPIASFKDAIVSAVESNQVVLIAGQTGCGKTTQVPQYLLDHMWCSKQESCKIICTQPRRISAISVSERISWERGEAIGNNVGYKVRLESKGGRQSSVVFCTNGILLRVLVGNGTGSCIPDITHIIVDEIHERDCYSDFMLAIIRDFLPSNPHLRLILMSATLDAERFSGYFGGCPVVQVPGFTYPVRTYYLEDALSVLKSDKNNHLISADSNIPDGELDINDEEKVALDEAINLAWNGDDFDALLALVSSDASHEVYNYRQSSTWLTPLMVFAGKGRTSDVCKLLLLGADCKLKSKEGITALELAEKENQSEAAQIIREHMGNFQSNSQLAQDLLDKYMEKVNAEEVDVDLIFRLIRKICGDSEVGAILVFLPGWGEINNTKEKLLANHYFADSDKFNIICLHSRVPPAEQRKVFQRPPKDCRKIVLATNIAESAVTIDDVVFVIDSGRMKEKSYDPCDDVSTLQTSWVSKANAKQREGRAGRCQAGICYHLYSKLRAASLPEFRVPEVRRMPVDELCLQVKMLDPSCNVFEFLQKLMDPPVDESIANALTILKDIGALTPQEELTELGQKFGQLPLHPRISKMLYFAILVNCLDSALILACAADTKDPFTMPMQLDERKKAAAAKRELASLYGDHSDHLATVAAFHCWKKAKRMGQAGKFCSEYYVSPNAMKMLDNLRHKLQAELKRHGLISSYDSNCSLNAHDPRIIRAVLAVGLYPMMGRMCPPNKNDKRTLVETITGAKVRVPWISNKSSNKDEEPLIIFDEITRGDWGVHIRSYTVLPTIPLLLFSGEIAVAPIKSCDADKSNDKENHKIENEGDAMDIDKAAGRPEEEIMLAPENSVQVVVDQWLPFKITAIEIAQMYILRERLMASILFKVKHPRENLPPHLGASMNAIACILSYDGILRPSVQTAALEPSGPVVATKALGEDIPFANPSGSQGGDMNITPMGSKLESTYVSCLGNMKESLSSNLANGNEQTDLNTAPLEAVSVVKEPKRKRLKFKKVKAANVDLGNMEENKPSDPGNNVQTELKPTNKLDLGNTEENLPSNLANENEQSDPIIAVTEAALTVKEPKKKRSRSKKVKAPDNLDLVNIDENKPSDLANGNVHTEIQPANELGLANMEESLTSNLLVSENEQSHPNTTVTEAVATVKEPKKKRSRKVKAANNLDLGNIEENKPSDLVYNVQTAIQPANTEESLPSNHANENEQSEPNTTLTEDASIIKEPMKKRSRSKKVKAAKDSDLGNMEDNKLSDPANGDEQTELRPADTAPKTTLVYSDNLEECLPSNFANGNEQPDPKTTPMDSDKIEQKAEKRRSKSERRKAAKKQKEANNFNSGNMEENKPSDLANGNGQTELKLADTAPMVLDNMEECLPSNPANVSEQPDPNIASTEAASASTEPEKKLSKSRKRKAANNLDLENTEENKASDLANGNEQTELKPAQKMDLENMEESLPSNIANGIQQPDPNTAPVEAASAAKQKKKSRSKRRKLAKDANPSDNMEEKMPPTNGNEEPINTVLTKAASVPNNEAQAELKSVNKESIPSDDQPDPDTAPTEAAPVEIN